MNKQGTKTPLSGKMNAKKHLSMSKKKQSVNKPGKVLTNREKIFDGRYLQLARKAVAIGERGLDGKIKHKWTGTDDEKKRWQGVTMCKVRHDEANYQCDVVGCKWREWKLSDLRTHMRDVHGLHREACPDR